MTGTDSLTHTHAPLLIRIFFAVIQKILNRETEQYLDCVPPWLTSDKTKWCRGENKPEKFEEFFKMVNEIAFAQRNTDSCPVPCKTTQFYVNDIGFVNSSFSKSPRF